MEDAEFPCFDFGVNEICLDAFEFEETPPDDESRYCKPRIHHRQKLMPKMAEDLVDQIKIGRGESAYCFTSGRFTFGDFVKAFILRHNLHILKMHISTLSMSEKNITDLGELIRRRFIDELDLHISIYFFAHERNMMIPFCYECLDFEDRFQLVVSAIHSKIVCMKTEGGKHITIHGSANLRTSDNVEQIQITESEELYKFNIEFLDKLKDRYKTINKPLRGKNIPWL